ncbi:PxKF domain-containing protein [Kribbella sp. HUAS MG21]|uniref:PxKF domain-containing protein n=1 Tax=Kribbella sp. HUAS MG21 TaxID=3160966 RepID=A0AAU7T841_9ACTN
MRSRNNSPRPGVAGRVLVLVIGALMLSGGLQAAPALAAGVTSASFSGGAGTVSVDGTLFAKQGAALTLTVGTSDDTRCVAVTGAATVPRQTSNTAKTTWTFTTTAPAGDGVKAFTVAASPNFNANGCTGQSQSTQASYTLDNTGPAVAAALSPVPNAAGWNNTDTTVRWTATDTASGVSATQPFKSETVTSNGIVNLTAPAQVDRLGNTGAAGAVSVRVDKAKPTITATQTANANGTVTVAFLCADSNSGGQAASGIASCVADGTTPPSNSKTVPAGSTVTGTATDKAGNVSTSSMTVAAADATAPTIEHSVAPAPNAAGWNNADATVSFACTDNEGGSGIASCVADGTSPASTSKTVSAETDGTVVGGTATDNAGNKATRSVTVKLDETVPSVVASKDRASNAAGWYDADVTVSFACADALSGVASCPAPKVLTEGANQSATGSGTDNAGNTESASVVGVNVDKTPPVLTGSVPAGWHTGDVTVSWTCTDALSGPAAQPADTKVTGEGANLTSTATCLDEAGNTTTKTITGIQIDRTAPITGITGASNDWTNGSVTVTLAATDGLSGVSSTSYTVDGGELMSGTTFTLAAEGEHVITFFSKDKAGNVEDVRTARVKIDKSAPTINHVFAPPSYRDGDWSNQDVTVTFDCADQGGSGVAGCTAPVTKSAEGESQPVAGTATDNAGNSATDTAFVSIDKTAPSVVASKDRAANSAGWYDADVTVSFACADALSGVASCPAPKVLGEGANQSATGSGTDNAGNTDSASVVGVNVDKTAPVLTGSVPAGWHTGDVTVSWTCTDALSGPAVQPADTKVTGEGANLTATATCLDKAGNTTTKTITGIQIDRTAPATALTVSGALHNGWYQSGINVALTADDNLAGVDSIYYSIDGGAAQLYSAQVPVAEDGTHTLTYWSTDKAGNIEDKTGNSVTLKIDKTPPALNGAPTSSPNAAGWYRDDVTVSWTCSDGTSGIDGSCPADSTIGGEGLNLGANASVSDKAGNSTGRTVGEIKIDRSAPTTTAQLPALPTGGWYSGTVDVTLDRADNLSGVETTYYELDGGAVQVYTGPLSVTADGVHEVRFWSKDKAGNTETAGAPLTFRIDKTAPVTEKIHPISPESGWFVTSGIPFAFGASDARSGVMATYYAIDGGAPHTYGEPLTVDLSTGTHKVTYWSVDLAGNKEATRSFDVNVDTIAPVIKGSQSPAPNSYGWNNADVDVTFSCTDADSGINGVAGCAGDARLTNDGSGQTVAGDAVDVAGNRSRIEYGPVNLDKTRPTLQGVLPAGARDGWYKDDLIVEWVGDDALSGIDPLSRPAAAKVVGEGDDLRAGPVTVKDKAGNESAPASVGVKIDRTAPVITGGPTTQPNAAGWFSQAVVVDFSCTDNLSGVASCPTSKVVQGNGANQSVTSDPALDVAGNERAGKTVGGINVDGTAPTTTANNQCTRTNGWCTGSTANVVLAAMDQTGLSGVKEIRYQIDGGTVQVAAGATKTVSVPLDGSGAGSVAYWAVDNAGNAEGVNKVALKWDNIAPAVTHTVTPKPNNADWNNTDVTVHFDAKDDDAGSGVKPGSVTPDVLVSTETAELEVLGSAEDTAGNKGSDKVTVKLDKSAPTITAAVVAGTKGANGWYTSNVTVKFTCADALSRIASCPDPVVLTKNGANTASGTATDNAGNVASATVSGITIDQELPTLTAADVNVAGAAYTLGAVPAASCTATDNVSGLASCKVTVTGGTANGVGTHNYVATATDKAGNTTTLSGTYTVKYRFDGFLQPINDTAHQVGVSTSIFKAGSSVPAKFQLKKNDGTVVQAGSAPLWLLPAKGSATSAPVDESVYAGTADSGTSYRYDATAQQYLYTWKSASTGGSYWRIGVKLDDGQTYYVNVGLR